ncbi:MAG: molecular chaperone DnaJ [Denitrovibrio sp.]|nr:MAG: molecular chaperone DnaJ [Denitrovibrio sp.]
MARDYYEILELSKGASAEEIKKAYRKLARKYHPDVNSGDDTAEAKFKEVSEAYSVLSDTEKKQQYDSLGHDAFKNGGHGHDFSGANFDDIRNHFGGGFGDIFGDLFGGGGGRGRRSHAPRKGEDIHYTVQVPFKDTIMGNEYELAINHTESCKPCGGKGGDRSTCSACGGSGQTMSNQRGMIGMAPCSVCKGTGETLQNVCNTCRGSGYSNKQEKIKVKIPKGVSNDSKIRVPNKGNAGKNGGPQGDLYIITNVQEHEVFKRQGNNVFVDVDMDMFEAALGEKIIVPTPFGTISMNIPAGTQPGQKFRVKGKGVPGLGKSHDGDLYVVIKISIPAITQEDDRKTLSEIQKKYTTGEREKLIEKARL